MNKEFSRSLDRLLSSWGQMEKLTPAQAEELHEKAFEYFIKDEISLEDYERITKDITESTNHSVKPQLRLITKKNADLIKKELSKTEKSRALHYLMHYYEIISEVFKKKFF